MQIVMKKVADLKPYERNPRKNEKAVEYVANSIKEFGFKVPLVIKQDGEIVTGHTRYKASIRLGLDEVPCIIADDLTDEQIKAFRLADNKTSEISEWDDALLDLEKFDIKLNMELFGFFEDEEDESLKKVNGRQLQSMELKAFEHWDYVVFVFDNQQDWINVVNEFGIHKVDAGYGKTKKVGVGRVINGARLLERIRHKDSNS